MSDEDFPAISISSTGSGRNLKPHKSEQWEIDMVGNFLLTLYHRLVIGPQNDWVCMEDELQKEFEQFMASDLRKRLREFNGTDNPAVLQISALLQRSRFILSTPTTDSPFYKVKSEAILDYRNKRLMEQDKRRTMRDDIIADRVVRFIPKNLAEHKDFEQHNLHYQGTKMQKRRQNYRPTTDMSCVICQQDFNTMDGYRKHIKIHNIEEHFEYLKELSQFESPIFSVSYRLSKDSKHFCFTFETPTKNLVIEKIIIVQYESMSYVHNKSVPYDMALNGREHFYVDANLFAKFEEQAIVLVCHLKDGQSTRIIEEHHYKRDLESTKKESNFSDESSTSDFDLPLYLPPLEIYDALKGDVQVFREKIMKTSNVFRDYVENDKRLQPDTIAPILTTLLHIEDMSTIKEYFNLLQYNVMLETDGGGIFEEEYYRMTLNSQGRVDIANVVTAYDDVIITTRNDIRPNSESLVNLILQHAGRVHTWVGHIKAIKGECITFTCSMDIPLNRRYTIIFRPSRLLFRHQYHALESLPAAMPFLEKFLFPEQVLPKPSTTLSSLSMELYNKTILSNPDQLQAVCNIAEGPRNDATYVIFGPPGTGKTTTLVESILQVLKRGGTKILITASSNSACDEVALRLCKPLDSINMSKALLRVFSKSSLARVDTIDNLLLEHSNMNKSRQYYPDLVELSNYRIVVCTMAVTAILYANESSEVAADYTHMFIDEVAASTEVEALMVITTILTPKSCLIIAGDHKQLGPVVKSKRAVEFNLGVSLMDRLMSYDCYQVNADTGDYDRSIQSRLRQNFRSHPAIVSLYSGLYYDHELEAKAKIEDVLLVKQWHLAPSKDFPIIFHNIDAESYADNRSFSLHNSDEINVVMDYVMDLMYFGINGKPVRECDIGVVTPYKKQYQLIRKELNLRKWYQIETGSVETFQGKEKEIIIVSFVRSRTPSLGFLESPRRLNVTLSRAKSLIVLIGNAKTLSMNAEYDHIIKECKRHKTLIDIPPSLTVQLGRCGGSNRYQPRNYNTNIMDMVTKNMRQVRLENVKGRRRTNRK